MNINILAATGPLTLNDLWPVLAGILMAFFLVVLGAYLCTFIVRMKKCLVIVGVFLLAFGCIVYMPRPLGTNPSEYLEVAINALSSFFPSRGEYAAPSQGEYNTNTAGTNTADTNTAGTNTGTEGTNTGTDDTESLRSLWYWIFHICTLFYVSTIIISVFGTNFCNKMLLAWRMLRRRRSQMNVFWGMNAESEAVASGIASKGGRTVGTSKDIVFVIPDRKKSWLGLRDDEAVHAVARKAFLWIFGSTYKPGLLVSARRHFFLGANGQENVVAAQRLIAKIPQEARKDSPISVYVRVSANADDDMLYRWADYWNAKDVKSNRVEVILIREESLAAKQLLLKYPMLDCPEVSVDANELTVNKEIKILIVGFGAQGKALLDAMVCDAQYLKRTDQERLMTVDVFDRSAASFGRFKEICGRACNEYGINFHRKSVHSADFWREMKSNITSESHYDRVVICTRDDKINIMVANDIAKIYRMAGVSEAKRIFARVRDASVSDYIGKALQSDAEDIVFIPFGRMTETYSKDIVVVDHWDRGAMWLNWKWRDCEELTQEEVWKSTSFFDRESSRASFFGMKKLLMLIGFEPDSESTEMQYDKALLTKEKLDRLAETEHLRWMAFHFLRGIETWDLPPTAQPTTTSEIKANRRKEINAHAALVEFSELPKVDDWLWRANGQQGVKKELQQTDRNFVLSLVPAMKAAGFGIKKRTVPEPQEESC